MKMSKDQLKNDQEDGKFISPVYNGIRLSPNHAKMVWQENKQLIVSGKDYKTLIGNLFYFVGGNEAFGVIKITNSFPINNKEFDFLKDKHRVSKEERVLWWPGKQKFFAHEFEMVKRFEFPENVTYSASDEFIVQEINFMFDIVNREKELLELGDSYDAKELELDQLKSDLGIVFALNSSNIRGLETGFSDELIFSLGSKIIFELENTHSVVFHPEHMSEEARELFDLIKSDGVKNSEFEFVKDCIVLRDVIFSSGKDIVISIDNPSEKFRQAIESRIFKVFPDEKLQDSRVIWNESIDGFKEIIPLYDLVLVKKSEFKRVLCDNSKVKFFEPFYPMLKGKKFSELDELCDFLYR